MLIYEDTKEGFQDDILDDKIVEEIKKGFEEKGLGVGNKNEIRSWRNSLRFMNTVLNGSSVPDNAGVAIELNIPTTINELTLFCQDTMKTATEK